MEALSIIVMFGFEGENYEVPFASRPFTSFTDGASTSYQSLEECNEGIVAIVKNRMLYDPVICIQSYLNGEDYYVASVDYDKTTVAGETSPKKRSL